MRNPNGFTFETLPDGKVVEGETFMCGHCNRHTIILPKQRPEDIGGHCPNCWRLLCTQCVGKMTHGEKCEPLEAWLERIHENWRKIQSRAA